MICATVDTDFAVEVLGPSCSHPFALVLALCCQVLVGHLGNVDPTCMNPVATRRPTYRGRTDVLRLERPASCPLDERELVGMRRVARTISRLSDECRDCPTTSQCAWSDSNGQAVGFEPTRSANCHHTRLPPKTQPCSVRLAFLVFGVRSLPNVAPSQGFEPRPHGPEPCVLPLDKPGSLLRSESRGRTYTDGFQRPAACQLADLGKLMQMQNGLVNHGCPEGHHTLPTPACTLSGTRVAW